MAIQPYYDGPALVRVNCFDGAGMASLGYTEDGCEPQYQGYWLDVHGDQNGGLDGPPIDIQYLGEIAIIRMLLTSWEYTVADKIAARLASATSGTPSTPGTLMFTESKFHRLLISPTVRPQNFPRAIPRENIEINKGTKHSKLLVVYHAYKDGNGVLYNTTTA